MKRAADRWALGVGGARAAAGSIVVLACALAACGGERGAAPEAVDESEKAGGMAVVCTQNAPEGLNAFVSSDLGAADLRLLLFTPLVLYGEDGTYRPHLAARWEWSEDRRSLIFEIRDDVTWHDGRPLTAADVAFTLDIARQPEYAYPSADDYADLRELVVRDSLTVELHFATPGVGGLEQYAWLPILPRHLLADLEPSQFASAAYHRSPIGSGPFEFSGRRPDGTIILERYEGYPEGLGVPYLDRIAIRTIVEPSAILVELVNGGVDVCLTDAALAERTESLDRLDVIMLEPPRLMVFPLNTRHPALDDVRVRRALSAALDRSELATAVAAVAEPAGNPFPESSPWFDPEVLQPDDDSVLAASLLDSAGWHREGAVRTNGRGQELRFELAAPQTLRDALTVAQSHWRSIGVQVELRLMEYTAFLGVLQEPVSRPDIMALSFYPEKVFTPDLELFAEFHSEGFFNFGSYASQAVDSMIERLALPIEADERRRIYEDVQRQVVKDVPMVFVAYIPRLEIVGPRLHGVETDLNGPFASITGWWLSPKR